MKTPPLQFQARFSPAVALKALLVTTIAIILSFAASVANLHWLAAIAMVAALVGAYVQYRDTLAFECVIELTDWQKDATDYRLVITAREHKKSRPTATIYIGKAPHFEEAICDIGILEQTAEYLPQKFAACYCWAV